MMHALSLKVFIEFNATTRTCLLGRETYNSADLAPGKRRVGWGCKDLTRTCGIVASVGGGGGGCGGESLSSKSGSGELSPSSFLSRTQTYALLRQQMEVAAKSEDYEAAARIRDSLKSFEEEEPVLRLRRLMKRAVAEERFEDAARYRDELMEIAPHSLLKCLSDATTLGIRVQVRSVYIEGRSQPSKGQYFFAYRVRITNNSDRPVQLLRRHWIITDAHGKTENVWGAGVIGEQPVILPRTGFEYSSACPLSTPSGRMEGDFEMKHIDRVGSQTFNVAIAPFSLSTMGEDADYF
ncbi:Protein ApaG [Melia azedarach]|uniref:Protein ApaG n=1 Tax=Melia azedarach TaxID=155640 RepID=A0ACC1XM97_MELAZ|nr:Protein ApaG [Melia azedarach]